MENVNEKEKTKALAAAKEVTENVKRARILENYNRSNQVRKRRRLEYSQNAREIDLHCWCFCEGESSHNYSSEERQKLAAIGGLNIEGLSVIDGTVHEIPGEVIHVDQDEAFSTFRDPETSVSDCSDVEEAEDSSAI